MPTPKNPTHSAESFFEMKSALQLFQTERLDKTYADLKSHPEYHDLGRFFFEQLYGPQDFSFRDASLRTLHSALRGKIHKGILAAVDKVLELQELSDRMDDRMVEGMLEAGLGPVLTAEQYETVYRSLDNYPERLHQIDLAVDVTRDFHRLSRKWVVGLSLKTARRAAHFLDMAPVMDFIYEGYTALQKISAIDEFVETIDRRERAYNRNVFFGDARP